MLDEFVDQFLKELIERRFSLVDQLIKAESASHDRLSGRIQALTECEQLLRHKRKSWTTRKERDDDE